jgi:hypothetical protein
VIFTGAIQMHQEPAEEVAAVEYPHYHWELLNTARNPSTVHERKLEMELDGKKIAKYRATTKIYFDIEK